MLNENIASLQKWHARLPFDVSEAGNGSQVVDVMCAIKPNAMSEVIFPSNRYPPTKPRRELLQKDLQHAATDNGFELIVVQSDDIKTKLGCSRS